MPASFDRCVKAGGKVRTVSGPNKQLGLKAGQYMRVCVLSGNVFRGHIETKTRESFIEALEDAVLGECQ